MMRTYLIPGLIVLLAAVLLLALPRNNSFRMEPGEVLSRMEDTPYMVDSSRLDERLKEGGVLVNLDPEQGFAEAHLSGAVNFPPEQWSPAGIRKFFRDHGKCILYAEDPARACEAWMLFTRMGVKDLLVLNNLPHSREGIDAPSFVFTPVGTAEDPLISEGAGTGE